MADYNAVEDLLQWWIDNTGEALAKIDVLNGEEPTETMNAIRRDTEEMHKCALRVIEGLAELLVQKKREEYAP